MEIIDIKFVIQIILILIILLIAGFMFINKFRKYNFSKKNKENVPDMRGLDFEEYLSSLFFRMGFKNRVTPGSYDFGADIILSDGKKKIVIQAKRYKSKVGIKAVQEVFTAQHFFDADESYLITNSTFTKPAMIMAKKLNVKLVDKNKLKMLEKKYLY